MNRCSTECNNHVSDHLAEDPSRCVLIESRESNGLAAAFEDIQARFLRVNPIPGASTVLLQIDHWMEDDNSEHRHSWLSYRSPREYNIASPKSVRLTGQLHGGPH
jgi:transposase InsO family protein